MRRSSVGIDRALAIDGWMTQSELSWLAMQAAEHSMIAEIGSWMGRSTAALADHTDGIIYAVDTWMGTEIEPAHKAILSDKPKDWLFHRFMDNVAHNVAPFRMESLDAAAYFARKRMTFDMIFIDGAHDVESVKADILAWKPLLAPGGLLCGHDYFTTVKEAVDELLVASEAPGTTIWVMDSER